MNKYAYTPRREDNFSVKELDDMNRKLDAWLKVHEKHKPEGSMTFKERNQMQWTKGKNRESGHVQIGLIVTLSLACAAFLCWSALYTARAIAKANTAKIEQYEN